MAGWRLREDLQFKLKGHLLENQQQLILQMNFQKVSAAVKSKSTLLENSFLLRKSQPSVPFRPSAD